MYSSVYSFMITLLSAESVLKKTWKNKPFIFAPLNTTLNLAFNLEQHTKV